MLKLVTLALPVCMAGCASKAPPPPILPVEPVYKLRNYDGPEAMTSEEVFIKSRECVMNRMRPNVHYLYVATDQGKAPVPISVICSPF